MAQQRGLTDHDVVRMRDSLRVFDDELSGLLRTKLLPAEAGTQAASEIASSPCADELNTAFSQGTFLIESAAEHLWLFTKGLDEPAQTFAPLTCARGVLEASAYAVWLLDPSINAETRISRSMGRRIKGLDEQRKFSESTGDAGMIGHAQSRLALATQQPVIIGLEAVSDYGPTDVIKRSLNAESEYRLLSAIAHGHNWALAQAGYDLPQPGNASINAVEKKLNPSVTFYAGFSAFQAITKAAWCVVMLFDLDRKRFSDVVEGHFERLGAEPKCNPYWKVS